MYCIQPVKAEPDDEQTTQDVTASTDVTSLSSSVDSTSPVTAITSGNNTTITDEDTRRPIGSPHTDIMYSG